MTPYQRRLLERAASVLACSSHDTDLDLERDIRAELDAAKYVDGDAKDAARYRFLKSGRGNVAAISWNSFHSNIYATAKMGNIDAAIDAAMRECELSEGSKT